MRPVNAALAAAALVPALVGWTRIRADHPCRPHIAVAAAAGLVAFGVTVAVIPRIAQFTLRGGFFGKDLCKKHTPEAEQHVPEALGLVSAAVFIVTMILIQLNYADTPEKLALYNAAALSVCFMTLLGFVDDAVDLPWRYKLLMPAVASLPLLCSYRGVTAVVVPHALRSLLAVQADGGPLTTFGGWIDAVVTVDVASRGALLHLGKWYLAYMGLMTVFCTNSINILAGVNGLEAGQSFVIASALLYTNFHELSMSSSAEHPHLFSAMLLLPFIGVTLGLLKYNWFPARVFVGDTFCYFAGMTLAVVGILGHFSKTLLLFLIPQIFNFLYSSPQLFKLYPCPRHRLPLVDMATGCLVPSTFELGGRRHANMTLPNLVLRVCGPLSERSLVLALMGVQAVCCVAAVLVRYNLSRLLYHDDLLK